MLVCHKGAQLRASSCCSSIPPRSAWQHCRLSGGNSSVWKRGDLHVTQVSRRPERSVRDTGRDDEMLRTRAVGGTPAGPVSPPDESGPPRPVVQKRRAFWRSILWEYILRWQNLVLPLAMLNLYFVLFKLK